MAEECRTNPALTRDEDAFVADTLRGLSPHPAYYVHMAPLNAAGPGPVVPTLPQRVDPAALRRRIRAGEWVVDLRRRAAYAAGHLPGSLNFGIDGSFLTYLGWLIPWGTPLSLVAQTPADAMTAVRELCRIGIERTEAMAVGDPLRWGGGPVAAFRRVQFAELAQVRAAGHRPLVLDVRRNDERASPALEGSRGIPLHELPARLAELPIDRTVWVHCGVGYRASIATGLLERAGRHVVLIDDAVSPVVASGPPDGVRAGPTHSLSAAGGR